MTKRDQVLTIIRAQVSQDGKADHISIRLYCENRVSYAAFLKAVREGQEIYRRSIGRPGAYVTAGDQS